MREEISYEALRRNSARRRSHIICRFMHSSGDVPGVLARSIGLTLVPGANPSYRQLVANRESLGRRGSRFTAEITDRSELRVSRPGPK
jgi:hypothetical protein